MSRIPIPLYVTDQIMTVGHANIFWRGNELASWTYQNAGDMVYASDLDTLGKLEVDNRAGHCVIANADEDTPELGGLVYGFIRKADESVAISDAVWSKVEMLKVVVNKDGTADTQNMLTVPFNGPWLWVYGCTYETNTDGFRELYLREYDGTAGVYNSDVMMPGLTGVPTTVVGIRSHLRQAGWEGFQMIMKTYQNSGVLLNLTDAWMALILQRGYT